MPEYLNRKYQKETLGYIYNTISIALCAWLTSRRPCPLCKLLLDLSPSWPCPKSLISVGITRHGHDSRLLGFLAEPLSPDDHRYLPVRHVHHLWTSILHTDSFPQVTLIAICLWLSLCSTYPNISLVVQDNIQMNILSLEGLILQYSLCFGVRPRVPIPS